MSKLEIVSYQKNNQTRFNIVVSETQTPLKLSQSFNNIEKAQEQLSALTKKLTDKNGNFHLVYADKLNADHKIDGKIVVTKNNYEQMLKTYHNEVIDYLKTNHISHQDQLFMHKAKIDQLYELYEKSVHNIIIGATPHSEYPSQYCAEYPTQITFHQSIYDILVQYFNLNVNLLVLNVQIEFYVQKKHEYINDNDYRLLMEHLETIVDIVDTHIVDNDN